MELLIYLALAAVFIGGILTLTGKAGADAEVRQTVQDISDIDNAMRSFYGAQRLAYNSTVLGDARLEAVVAAQVDRMADASGTIITQFGTGIGLNTAATSASNYGWPNYKIAYTGMRTETCASLLGALTGPIAVQLSPGDAAVTVNPLSGWAVNKDHRAEGLTSAADIEAFCAGTAVAGTGETYTVHAVYRI